jgi:hypothetical protein
MAPVPPDQIGALERNDVAGGRRDYLLAELAELLWLLDLQLHLPGIRGDQLDALREARTRLGHLHDLFGGAKRSKTAFTCRRTK